MWGTLGTESCSGSGAGIGLPTAAQKSSLLLINPVLRLLKSFTNAPFSSIVFCSSLGLLLRVNQMKVFIIETESFREQDEIPHSFSL